MVSKKVKGAVLAAMAGAMLFGSGCLGNVKWQTWLVNSAVDQLLEFVFDNDAVFDLFEDGNVAAQE
jgi:hypothetical protein